MWARQPRRHWWPSKTVVRDREASSSSHAYSIRTRCSKPSNVMNVRQVLTLVTPDGAYGGPARVAFNQAGEIRAQGHAVHHGRFPWVPRTARRALRHQRATVPGATGRALHRSRRYRCPLCAHLDLQEPQQRGCRASRSPRQTPDVDARSVACIAAQEARHRADPGNDRQVEARDRTPAQTRAFSPHACSRSSCCASSRA